VAEIHRAATRAFAGLEVDSVHSPDDVEGIVEKWRASLASGEPFLHETRVLRADGQYRWMLHHKVALRNQQDKIVKWYGIQHRH